MKELKDVQKELEKYMKILEDPKEEIIIKDMRDCVSQLCYALSVVFELLYNIDKRQKAIGVYLGKKFIKKVKREGGDATYYT